MQVNADTFKLTGDTLQSVNQVADEDEEEIYEELYRELVAADTRNTRSQRGRGRGVPVGRGKGLLIRPLTSTGSGCGQQTYVRRGSTSSNPIFNDIPPRPTEPSFDDDGNLLSEPELESPSSASEDSSLENSLDEHSDDATSPDASSDGNDDES